MQTLLLLDLDGTLIDTPHYEAWRRAASRVGIVDFTHREYVVHVAGRPRLEGASRLLAVKKGEGQQALSGLNDKRSLAQAKQSEFLRLAERTRLFADARRLLERVRDSRQRIGFYTASENAPRLFEAALRQSDLCPLGGWVIQQSRGQSREALFASLANTQREAAIVVVDDAPYAIDAACRLGMQGYQIRRNAYEPLPTEPSARSVASLDDIAVPIRDRKRTGNE